MKAINHGKRKVTSAANVDSLNSDSGSGKGASTSMKRRNLSDLPATPQVTKPQVSHTSFVLPPIESKRYEQEYTQTVPSFEGGKNSIRHFCIFCKQQIAKLPNHLETIHKQEDAVKHLMGYPKGHKVRKKLLTEFRNKGALEFNLNREYNRGVLKVARRPRKDQDGRNYVPCPSCCRYICKTKLRQHHFVCSGTSSNADRTLLATSRKLRDDLHASANDILRDRVFPVLRDDEPTRAIRYDRLAIACGNFMTSKYATSANRDQLIRANLRYLGRLILESRLLNSEVTDLASLLKRSMMDIVVRAINTIVGFSVQTCTYRAPVAASLLVALCKTVAELWLAMAINDSNVTQQREALDFLSALKNDTGRRINKMVTTYRAKTKHKSVQIPDSRDTDLLTHYLECGYTNAVKDLENNGFTYDAWKSLASHLLVAIMVFNRLRPAKIHHIEMEDHRSATCIDTDDPKYQFLTAEEKDIFKENGMFIIRNKSIDIFLNGNMKDSLDLLVKYRKKANVPDTNPFVFGLPGGRGIRHNILNAGKQLSLYSTKCGARNPKFLRSRYLWRPDETSSTMPDLPTVSTFHDVPTQILAQETLTRNVVVKLVKLTPNNLIDGIHSVEATALQPNEPYCAVTPASSNPPPSSPVRIPKVVSSVVDERTQTMCFNDTRKSDTASRKTGSVTEDVVAASDYESITEGDQQNNDSDEERDSFITLKSSQRKACNISQENREDVTGGVVAPSDNENIADGDQQHTDSDEESDFLVALRSSKRKACSTSQENRTVITEAVVALGDNENITDGDQQNTDSEEERDSFIALRTSKRKTRNTSQKNRKERGKKVPSGLQAAIPNDSFPASRIRTGHPYITPLKREFMVCVDDCKKRSRNIKDTYRKRQKNGKGRTGKSSNKAKNLPLADVLPFRDQVGHTHDSISSVGVDDKFTEEEEEEEEVADEIDDGISITGDESVDMLSTSAKRTCAVPVNPGPTADSIRPSHNRRQRQDNIIQMMEDNRNERNILLNGLYQNRDDIDLFFKSIAMSVKKLTPELINEAKMSALQMVFDLERRNASLNRQPSSPACSSSSRNSVIYSSPPSTPLSETGE